METLTNSRLKAFRRCPRLHYYAYELRRRPIKTALQLGFGTLFHAGLEQWWLYWLEAQDPPEDAPVPSSTDALNVALGAMALTYTGFEDVEVDDADAVMAEELMRGYHFRWRDDVLSGAIRVRAVESQFDLPLVNPETMAASRTFRLSGKLDVRIDVRTHHGWEHATMEHKTSTADITPGSDYWQRLRMDSQVTLYVDAERAEGFDTSLCVYDVAKRPTLRPRLATPEESRRYTKGTGCKACGGKRGGVKGSGYVDHDPVEVAFSGTTVDPCPDCEGTGWKDAPRLDSRQRDRDETIHEFRCRVSEHIATRPDEYFQRADVIRLDAELAEYRYDTWQQAKQLRERQLLEKRLGVRAWPRNPDGCEVYGRRCQYWKVCTGGADIADNHLFRTTEQHEELTPKEGKDASEEAAK